MPKKVPAKNNGADTGKQDFSDFMSNMMKGVTTLRNLSDRKETFYKFGNYSLDRALGGGLPAGQIYAFQGPSGTGKTLAALQIAKAVIDSGSADDPKHVLYFDIENKISIKAQKAMGLFEDPLLSVMSVETLEDVLDTMMQVIESDMFGMVVIDSIDALVTDEQNERNIHDGSKVGGYKAKALSEWLGKITQLAAAHNCSVLLIQQIRDNPGQMYGGEVTSGGKAVIFYATTRLRFGPNKEDNQEEDGKIAWQGAKVKIMKMNQGALPKEPIPIRFYIGDRHPWGVDKVSSAFAEAKRLGILAPQKVGSSKYVPCRELCKELDMEPDELSFNGKNNVLTALSNDPILLEAVGKLIDESDGTPLTDNDDEELEVVFEEIDE